MILPAIVIIPATVRPMTRPANPGGARWSTATPMITSIRTKVAIASTRIACPYPIPGNGEVAPSPPIVTADAPSDRYNSRLPAAAPMHCETIYPAASRDGNRFVAHRAMVTAGLTCAPETRPSV